AHRDAYPTRPGPPHPRAHLGGDRAPALHGGGRRPGAGVRRREDRAERIARRTRGRARRLRRPARLLGALLGLRHENPSTEAERRARGERPSPGALRHAGATSGPPTAPPPTAR